MKLCKVELTETLCDRVLHVFGGDVSGRSVSTCRCVDSAAAESLCRLENLSPENKPERRGEEWEQKSLNRVSVCSSMCRR